MSVHYNVQIHVQRVEKVGVEGQRHSTPGRVAAPAGKIVTEVLDVKVTADSEAAAYAKVQRLLVAHAGPIEESRIPLDDYAGQ